MLKIKVSLKYFTPFLFLYFTISPFTYTIGDDDITSEEIISHIKYLASDDLAGRFPGTVGDSLAGEYIIKEFKSYGLIPKGDDGYKQRFDFVSEVKLGQKNSFSLTLNDVKTDYTPGVDFTPLGISSVGKAEGEMVFVGYGINAPELNYNDFKDVDLKDKIAVILRYIPGHQNRHDNPFSKYERTRTKYNSAKNAGAKGIILITGPESDSLDVLLKLSTDRSSISDRIPIVQVKRNIIEKVFESNGKSLTEVQKQIDSSKSPNSFYLNNASVKFETDFYQIKSNTANIIGFLEGQDPSLKNEVIVIGAHMDHLGDGLKYGSLNEKNEPAIHNGADDNASGTAGVLELAEKFVADKKNLKRSLLFMLFGAEEAGLIGSAYFTKSDLFKNFHIVTMINMDMIGRLNENKLIVNGSGTSSVWKILLDSINKNYNFTLSFQDEGFGRSDYSSFYAKDLPVLGFFTGLHKDYHKPSDDWDLIKPDDEAKILNLIYDAALAINNMPSKPDFVKTKQVQQESTTGFRVTVGVIPDYSSNVEGLQIVGLRPGGPGEKAGLLAGDIIIKFGSYEIKNIYDYTEALGKFNPGDEAELVVKRGNEEITLKVVFTK